MGKLAEPFANLGNRLLELITGRGKRATDASTLDSLLGELRQAVEQMAQAGAPPSRGALEGLVTSLTALVAVLTVQSHTAKDEVQRLVDDGRQILTAWNTASDADALKDRLVAYVAEVYRVLSGMTSSPAGQREDFWKTAGHTP
jgi:hypothetical protein